VYCLLATEGFGFFQKFPEGEGRFVLLHFRAGGEFGRNTKTVAL
jgi:hypothetical protein